MLPIVNFLMLMGKPSTVISINRIVERNFRNVKFYVGSVKDNFIKIPVLPEIVLLEVDILFDVKTRIRYIRKTFPSCKILLIGNSMSAENAIDLVKIGVWGSLSTSTNEQEVSLAVEKILKGEVYLSEQIR